jgi:hypothetical protein
MIKSEDIAIEKVAAIAIEPILLTEKSSIIKEVIKVERAILTKLFNNRSVVITSWGCIKRYSAFSCLDCLSLIHCIILILLAFVKTVSVQDKKAEQIIKNKDKKKYGIISS